MHALYRATGLPTFQNHVFATPEEARAAPTGDVVLAQDDKTGLVRNVAFEPSLMAYDSRYQNEQSHSAAFRAHLEGVADIVVRGLGTESVVEIGCGQGVFLDMLAARGCSVRGCDPAYEGADPRISRSYFSPDLGLPARSGIVLRHVLEHTPDPLAFLTSIRDANNGGLIYIEAPDFDWILQNNAWYSIFYEHVTYFRLGDFKRLFGRVLHAERTFGGQYLSVVADLATLREPSSRDPVTMPAGFGPKIEVLPRDLFIWGASSKGVLFAIAAEKAGKHVIAAIDINPAKIGGYMPVTGTPIRSPEEVVGEVPDGGTIFVMNANYLREIAQAAGPRVRCVGVESLS